MDQDLKHTITNKGKAWKTYIKDLLIKYPRLRDNDQALFANCVWKYCKNKNIDLYKITGKNLLQIMIEDKQMPHFETIRRTRQRIQEQFPETRGLLYEKRQKLSIKTRTTIKNL